MNNKTVIYTLVFTVVFFTIAASSYLKNSVYCLEQELSEIKKNIQTDKEAIHVLNAEWATLNNPSRLRSLAEHHIKLYPVKSEQIINYSAIPFGNESGDLKKIKARKNIATLAHINKKIANNIR